MTPRQDSPYPEDWRRVAAEDWHRMHVMLRDEDPEGAGLFLQQALEKYLKGYLLSKGWKLKKVHTLPSLLDAAAEYAPELARFRDLCERTTGFYLAERYPSLGSSGLELEDVRQELAPAHDLIRTLFPGEDLSDEGVKPH